jgi:hypothetical protein
LNANGIEATATPGEKSQFDVLSDGALVFSKAKAERWPDDGEVLELLSR